MAYANNKKRFTLYKAIITPNHPVCTGYILYAVDAKQEDKILEVELLKVAVKHFGFYNPELQLKESTRLGRLVGFEKVHGSFALRTENNEQVTIHILDYANGEY